MRHIALEEAFFIAELAERQPMMESRGLMQLVRCWKGEYAERYARRLTDFTEYRLPEMDDAGIDIQVLSLTVPGLQVEIASELASDNARFVNDRLAQEISKHPDRFRGLPLCRCRTPPLQPRSWNGR